MLLLAFGLNALKLPTLWALVVAYFGHVALVNQRDHTFELGASILGRAHYAPGARDGWLVP